MALLTLRFAVQSHAGLRPDNEDAAYAGPRLLALCDGMGGHAAGEVAAALAMEQLTPLDQRAPSPDPADDLRAAVERADAAIARHTSAHPETAGMGTTLTALLFDGPRIALAHIGDSRAYLLRNGALQQLTHDDSYVQSLVDQGRLTPQEAMVHERRNIVLKVLTGKGNEPHTEVLDTAPGDRYLVCSDGLSDYVGSDEIAEILGLADPQRRPQEFIRSALRHGSQDNITCVVADVVEGASGYNIATLTGAAGSKAHVAG